MNRLLFLFGLILISGITFGQGNFFWSHGGRVYDPEYGLLYNWYAVDDSNGLAPSGLRIPSQQDVIDLYDYLETQYGTGVAGKILKSTFDWYLNGNGTDNVNFTALPSGRRDGSDGSFDFLYTDFDMWTSSLDLYGRGYYMKIVYNSDDFNYDYFLSKNYGMAIRPMRDLTSSEISSYSDGDVVEVITDYDGNQYDLIKIGNQGWIDSNLRVTHYSNGVAINHIITNDDWVNATSGAYCSYGNRIIK